MRQREAFVLCTNLSLKKREAGIIANDLANFLVSNTNDTVYKAKSIYVQAKLTERD